MQFHVSHEKSFILQQSTKHLSVVRVGALAMLIVMVIIDSALAGSFDFPEPCYLLVLSVILGLDIKKLYKTAVKKDE